MSLSSKKGIKPPSPPVKPHPSHDTAGVIPPTPPLAPPSSPPKKNK